MRAASLISLAVAGYVVGVSAAFLVAHSYFNVPLLGSYNGSGGLFLTSSATILAIDPTDSSITVDMTSPYSIYEHAPFQMTYSDKTSILIGNGVIGNDYTTKAGKPGDLAVGMKVQVRIRRQPGPLSVDSIKSL